MGAAETVTVLFTDVVRSTATAAALDRDAADARRRAHFDLLRGALVQCGGREVKNLGDGLMAVFSSAGSALTCAVSMQQRVERHSRDADVPVTMRIGISLGDATVEDGDYFGTPVIEAARLVAAAEGGQILVPGLLGRLVGPDGPVVRPIGALELKGLAEPLPAAEVLWEPLSSEPELFPLPPRLAPAIADEFYGRGDEVARLERDLEQALAGHRRTALISGEPGIGKTRLCAEVALTACARGAYVLYGRSEEGLGVPYQPVLEALRHLVTHAPDDLLQAYVAASGGEVARLVPEIADRVSGVALRVEREGDAERYALFGAVDALLTAAAVDRPVVLILDDLHWADRATVLLLRHLLTSTSSAGMLTLLTFRSSDLAQEHPLNDLRTDLHRHGGVEALELSGLEVEDIESLMAVLTGHPLDADDRAFIGMLHRETSGNPFFTREMLRHLVESGQLAQTEGRWRATGASEGLDLPRSVREVLAQRVTRLGRTAGEVLSTAAIIGRDFDVELLQQTVDIDEDELLDVLDAAVQARLLVESQGPRPAYAFAHALVEHTLYGSLSAARRARGHRRVGAALETVCGADPGSRIGELAHHWLRAGGAQAGKALAYAIAAAENATAQVAPQEAARWYADALGLIDGTPDPDPAKRLDVLVGLGIAERDSGDAGYREVLLEAARLGRRIGDAPRLVRAALANSRGFVSASGEVDSERIAVLEAALQAVGEDDTRARALLLATLAAELSFSPTEVDRRLALADEAVAIARRLNDSQALGQAQSMRFIPSFFPEAFEGRLENTAEGIAAAERAGDRVTLFHNLHWRAYAQLERGEIAEATDALHRMAALADELRLPTAGWVTAYDRATFAAIAGRLDEAEQLANDALQLGMSSGQPDALPFYASQMSSIRFNQGRLGEILPLLLRTAEQNPGIPAFRSGLALAHVEASLYDEGRRILLAEASDGFARIPRDPTRNNGLAIFSLVCSEVGERGPAALLHRLLSLNPHAAVFSGITWWGLVGHHLGNLSRVLGLHDEAVERLEAAEGRYERVSAPVWHARAQLDLAHALLARGGGGDARRARALLDTAVTDARDLGAAGVERRARELRSDRVAS